MTDALTERTEQITHGISLLDLLARVQERFGDLFDYIHTHHLESQLGSERLSGMVAASFVLMQITPLITDAFDLELDLYNELAKELGKEERNWLNPSLVPTETTTTAKQPSSIPPSATE